MAISQIKASSIAQDTITAADIAADAVEAVKAKWPKDNSGPV